MSAPKLLVALSFYEGDRAEAARLARFLADVEPVFNRTFDLLLLPRWDCPDDPETAEYCRTKFDVYTARSTIEKTGYPAGTFSTWRGCYDWALAAGRYAAVFTIEGDSAPLAVDWAAKVWSAWLRRPQAGVMGDLQPVQRKWGPHVNGNAVFSLRPEVAAKVQAFAPPDDSSPWDLHGYKVWAAFGVNDTVLIQSDFHTRGLKPEYLDRLAARGVVWHHGCKDESALQWAKDRLLTPEPITPAQPGEFFVYEDTVPSVFCQGLAGIRVEPASFADPTAFNFNPSIASVNGKLGMFYRSQDTHGVNTIRFGVLSPDRGSLVSDVRVEGLPEWGEGVVDHHEDPRFIDTAGKPQLSFTHSRYALGKPPAWKQCLAPLVFGEDGKVSAGPPTLLKFRRNTGRQGSFEKNWVFFDEGDRGHFVYATDPHEVVSRGDWAVERSAINPVAVWKNGWGEPRGGTSPVKVGDLWFSFFHSSTRLIGRRRRYHMGAYAFADARGRHTPRGATKKPLLTASMADGFSWREGEKDWEPVVVFPSGAVLENGVWTVSAGINDCQCVLFTIDHEELLKRMR